MTAVATVERATRAAPRLVRHAPRRRSATPLLITLIVVAAASWAVLVAFGGGPASRLGLLTGGAPLMSTGSTAGMAGMGAPLSTSTPSGTAPGMTMPGMAMGAPLTSAPAKPSSAAGTRAPGRMTMLGVSISGSDPVLSLPVFGIFLLMWTVMVLAMMLPVIAPAATRFSRSAPLAQTARFVAGTIGIWLLAGIPAYGLLAVLQSVFPTPGSTALRVGAVLIAAAGFYEFTAAKRRAHHRSCRCGAEELCTRPAWRAGVVQGCASVACCGPMMGVLLLAGMMNLAWMAALMAVMVLEAVLRSGKLVTEVAGAVFLIGALILLVAPRILPALA